MNAREAYHRRAYRVALLLTDAEGEALRILEEIARAIPSPQSVSDARFDRAEIQASRPVYEQQGGAVEGRRDGVASRLGLEDEAADLWARAHGRKAQELEAWVLCEAEQMDTVRAARAMDCSRNALEQIHLPNAKLALEREGYDEALTDIRHAIDALDTDHALAHIEGVLDAHASRSRLVTTLSILALLVCFGLMLFVLFDLLAWDDREEEVTGGADAWSNPIPDESDGAEDADTPDGNDG